MSVSDAPKPTFADVERQMNEGVQRALASGNVNDAVPPAVRQEVATPPPVVTPPVVTQTPPVVTQDPPAPAVSPAAGPTAGVAAQPQFVTVDAFKPMLQSFDQMAQAMWQQSQAIAQRLAPQQTQQVADAPKRPRAADLARTFLPPDRQASESDVSYAARSQAAMLDHLQDGYDQYTRQVIEQTSRQAVDSYRQQVEATVTQQRGAQAFESAVDEAVRSQGIDTGTDVGRFVRDQARANIIAHAASQDTRGWTAQHFRQLLNTSVSAIKSRVAIPQPSGAPPQLQVVTGGAQSPPAQRPVAAPVGGAGGTVPSIPPSGQPTRMTPEEARRPGSFNKVFEDIGNQVRTAIKGA